MVVQISSTLLVFLFGLAFAAVCMAGLAAYTATRGGSDSTYRAFTILLLGIVVWTVGQGGRLLAGTLTGKLR